MKGALKAALLPAVILTVLSTPAAPEAAFDIPVGNPYYGGLERLEVKGLIPGAILSTRPLSEEEAEAIISEAEGNLGRIIDAGGSAGRFIERLKKGIKKEGRRRDRPLSIEPLSAPYLKLLYSDGAPYFPVINNRGDVYTKGLNGRAGFAARAEAFDRLHIYLNPEFRGDEGTERVEVKEGYIDIDALGARLTAGRESLWWGPGYHGGLLLTDNAEPLDMARLTSRRPLLLPWVFGPLGPFKPTVFLARLEKDRDFPNANLLGMRLDFKPAPSFRFALSRVIMFGGEGRRGLSGEEWIEVFFASDSAEHAGSPIDGNQIVSIDASLIYAPARPWVPFTGVKLYAEWGAEDSSGSTKTPTGRALLLGAYVDEPFWIMGVDLRFEYADTARNERYGPLWYTHTVYTSGYTHEGRFIGHHMGGDSRDAFLRLQYHSDDGLTAGIEYDHEESGVHTVPVERDWAAIDARYEVMEGVSVSGGVGSEALEGASPGGSEWNTALWVGASWIF